jgi:hypothetical protein
VTAIVTSLLGGGWELIAGWVLPTALNSLFFAFLVLPAFRHVAGFHTVLVASHPQQALVLLTVAVVGGLVLSALQTPLYRVLEGYSWPAWARRRRIAHHVTAKGRLSKRLQVARLGRRDAEGKLSEAQEIEFAALLADPALARAPERRHPLSPLEVSLLAERLRRYPVDDGQVLATRLGNAIRRFEEYGWDRYRLDIITMWHALTGVVPKDVRKQVDAGRASVDFFVCLIYGHFAVALGAVAALAVDPRHATRPAVAIAAAVVLSVVWYWLAVKGTDEWAAAVRGLVDLGRKPLAESLALELPGTLERERSMWELVSRQSRRPHGTKDFGLDEFRATPAQAVPEPAVVVSAPGVPAPAAPAPAVPAPAVPPWAESGPPAISTGEPGPGASGG